MLKIITRRGIVLPKKAFDCPVCDGSAEDWQLLERGYPDLPTSCMTAIRDKLPTMMCSSCGTIWQVELGVPESKEDD